MSGSWFDHLSSTLSKTGMIAYIWNVAEDHFEWAGDSAFLFGDKIGGPMDNAQLHKRINPQEVPSRLSVLHDALVTDLSGNITPGFSASYKFRRENGAFIDIEETATVQQDENGNKMVCGVLKVISSPENAEIPAGAISGNVVPAPIPVQDEELSNYGRLKLQQRVEEWFDTRDQDRRSHGYLLAVGIDRMSLYNDVMGSRYADEIIEKTGARLRKIVGKAGDVMRIDGDVYGMFFHAAPHNEMAAVAKYVLNNFYNGPLETSKGPVGISVSVGGVTLDQAKDPPSAITMAEMAMHVAKDKGRSCFVSYDEAAHAAEDNHYLLRSADQFMRALKGNRLRFAFQPIIGSQTNAVTFHECLMRIIDDDGKLISAGDFIPAIEKLGLSRLVDQHALRMAIDELDMFSDVVLSVNVSNLSLTDGDWMRSLVAALRDRPSVARRLIVEITESTVIENPEKTKRTVRTMQELGCRVALDDFGAGYTAFSFLKELNVDIVKIDKSFIRNINDGHNHLFVKTLKMLAEGVNVETVGEGAETMAEAKLLASEGIDHVQGYVYGFPRIERLWLPRDHVHRQISLEKKVGEVFDYSEEISRWAKGSS